MTAARFRDRPAGFVGHHVLVIGGVVLLVLVPILVVETPREIARWRRAAAKEAELEGDYPLAVQEMDAAIAWNDQAPELWLLRAEYKFNTQQWQSGLDDCDHAAELVPDSSGAKLLASQFLMHLGRHETAIALLQELMQQEPGLAPGDRANLLNSIAYARAVGREDLAAGLEIIEESLALIGTRAGMYDPLGYLQFHRGYTALGQEEYERALESLNAAAESAEQHYQKNLRRLEALRRLPRAQMEYLERATVFRSFLAGLLHVRALLWDQLERADEAKKDRERLASLAPHGNLAMVEPHDLDFAVQRLQTAANMLDTRGFLHYQLGDLKPALRDLQQAIDIMETLDSNFDWQVEASRYRVTDLRPLWNSQQVARQALAVMCYHRMLVYEALDRQPLADQDRQRVLDLGYEPNEELF